MIYQVLAKLRDNSFTLGCPYSTRSTAFIVVWRVQM